MLALTRKAGLVWLLALPGRSYGDCNSHSITYVIADIESVSGDGDITMEQARWGPVTVYPSGDVAGGLYADMEWLVRSEP